MSERITGLHHVTAIATDPQQNVDFYAGTLGLRLVKKTVNFDDPGTYHFYYGDEVGHPGTILTFFPWPMARRGTRGSGQATVTSFSIAEGSLGYWRERLQSLGVLQEEVESRFDEETLAFYDPDGLKLELVAHTNPGGEPWDGGPVPAEHAIRGFHGVTLTERDVEATERLLTSVMGWRRVGESGARHRFAAPQDGGADVASQVDILHAPESGFGNVAAGTVHHVAWRVKDEQEASVWREKLLAAGFEPTTILDRQYFQSIYFREPGGVLFELATDPPGFTRDEEPEDLGTGLRLPPWLESHRQRIERVLPSVTVPEVTLPEQPTASVEEGSLA